jgi:dimethylaniline monooxygenase (N-oxide forming)
MEAMWWLAYLRGDMQHLPTSEPNYTLQSPQTSGLDFGIDYSAYMATLANDIGAKPTLFSLWRQYGLKVLLVYCFGASYVSVYRLTGPFKKKETMKPIVEGELLNTVKRRGLVGNFFFGLMPLVLFGMLNALALVLETVGLLDSREWGFGGDK